MWPPDRSHPPDVRSTSPLNAAFSPDGRWLAYGTGRRANLFVRRYPNDGRFEQVTSNGAHHPAWSPDGKELFYYPGPEQLTAVPVALVEPVRFGAPRPVNPPFFPTTSTRSARDYDLLPNGSFVRRGDYRDSLGRIDVEFRIVVNWFDEIRGKLGNATAQ